MVKPMINPGKDFQENIAVPKIQTNWVAKPLMKPGKDFQEDIRVPKTQNKQAGKNTN